MHTRSIFVWTRTINFLYLSISLSNRCIRGLYNGLPPAKCTMTSRSAFCRSLKTRFYNLAFFYHDFIDCVMHTWSIFVWMCTINYIYLSIYLTDLFIDAVSICLTFLLSLNLVCWSLGIQLHVATDLPPSHSSAM